MRLLPILCAASFALAGAAHAQAVPAGSGTLTPLDAKGRSWRLDFDGVSLAAYEAYLEDAATELCASPVSISDRVLELSRRSARTAPKASATLNAKATGVRQSSRTAASTR